MPLQPAHAHLASPNHLHVHLSCESVRCRVMQVLVASQPAPESNAPTTTVANLKANVGAVNDTALGDALANAIGIPQSINVSTTTAVHNASVRRVVTFACPRGKVRFTSSTAPMAFYSLGLVPNVVRTFACLLRPTPCRNGARLLTPSPTPCPPSSQWCTAGVVIDCTEGHYNPLEGQDIGTACIKCPEFSTSPVASTNLTDCTCQTGFIPNYKADGSLSCECDYGLEIVNGVRCDRAPYPMPKPGGAVSVHQSVKAQVANPCYPSLAPIASLCNTPPPQLNLSMPHSTWWLSLSFSVEVSLPRLCTHSLL